MNPILATIVINATALASPTPAGVWKGDIAAPGQRIGVVVHLYEGFGGDWFGSIDTPSQGSFGLPLSSVQVDGGHVIAACDITGATWDATLAPGGDELNGTWTQRGGELPLNCERVGGSPPVPGPLRADLAGTWEGPLSVGAVQLRVVLVLTPYSATTMGGYMVSPDQSPDRIPVGRVDWVADRAVRVLVGSVAAAFDVILSPEKTALTGTFTQGGTPFGIELLRVQEQSVINRPQNPQPPFPYAAEEVSYRSESGNVTLAGTLTIPEGTGPFPAALMITGSGAQDRNEEIFQHKPFWVIADHLSRRGIAVLRVDDRGVGESTTDANPNDDTSHDFARDVEAGVDFLRSQPRINPDAIGLIGHSEGGVIAPIVASRNPDVAFIILMAGTGVRGDELLLAQTAAIMQADGASDDELTATAHTNRKLFATLLDESLEPAEAERQMRAVIEADPAFAMATPEEQQAGMALAIAQLNTPWMKAFAQHDPTTSLKLVTCPVLAINGELDLQVPWQQNLPAIKAALESGGNTDVTTRTFPDLNHLFQHSETGLISEYGQIEETISPEVLDLLAVWINERFSTKAP